MKIKHLFFLFIFFLFFKAVRSNALEVQGYVSQGFLYSNQYNYLADTDGGTFQFNEMGINFLQKTTDDTFIGMQISARDLGDIGNDEPYIDWALADWRISDILGLRFGLLKIPVGFYNETRDIDMLRTSVLLPSGVYIELLRDAWDGMQGFGLYGAYSHSFLGAIDYQLAVGTGEIQDDSSTSKMFNSVFDDESIFNVRNFQVDKILTWGIQWHLPFNQFSLGNTFFFTDWDNIADLDLTRPAIGEIPIFFPGENPLFPNGHPGFNGCDAIDIHQVFPIDVKNLVSYTLSASIEMNHIFFSTEYFHLQLEGDAHLPLFQYANDTATEIINYGGIKTFEKEIEGYYIAANRRIADPIEIGAYYSWITNNALDKHGSDAAKEPGNHDYSAWLRDYCISILFEISDQWSFKVEGHLMDGHAFLFIDDNPAPEKIIMPEGGNYSKISTNEAAYPDRYWYMMNAKITFTF